ncbi:hypothetical protein GCM10027261_39020 [Geodermatophilus arenarius]
MSVEIPDGPDALGLPEALETAGHSSRHVGIGGCPEGHGHIDTALVGRTLGRKAPHATHVVTQLCFSAATTTAWARQVARRGVDLPIRIGLPGAVTCPELVRISARPGLGQSARFPSEQHSVFRRFLLPRGHRPDRLVGGLAPALGSPEHDLQGFHSSTFTEVARTEAWRQDRLARLSPTDTGQHRTPPPARCPARARRGTTAPDAPRGAQPDRRCTSHSWKSPMWCSEGTRTPPSA